MKTSLLLSWVMVFGCVGSAETKEYRVGALYWSMNIPGQVAMRTGLEDELAKINSVAEKTGAATVVLEGRVAGDGEAGIKN